MRRLTPGYWSQKLSRLATAEPSPKKMTAQTAVERGLFKRQPSVHLILRLVDFHVPHSTEEAEQGRGFDFEQLQTQWQAMWRLEWVQTYSFMGPTAERTLPGKWRQACAELATRYPQDGANFSTVWMRNKAAS